MGEPGAETGGHPEARPLQPVARPRVSGDGRQLRHIRVQGGGRVSRGWGGWRRRPSLIAVARPSSPSLTPWWTDPFLFLLSGGQLAPPCDIPSGCCFFTGPWTVTRSSLRMLRRVAAFCRPLRPVLLLVSFPRSWSPVVGVLGLCWMWHGVPFARQRRPVVGVRGLCWLLWGSPECVCCPHTSVLRPSTTCLSVFPCARAPGALLPCSARCPG